MNLLTRTTPPEFAVGGYPPLYWLVRIVAVKKKTTPKTTPFELALNYF